MKIGKQIVPRDARNRDRRYDINSNLFQVPQIEFDPNIFIVREHGLGQGKSMSDVTTSP